MIREGVIKWYDSQKGFGFIVNPEGEDVFFHWRALPGEDGKRTVYKGDTVTYIESMSKKGLRSDDVLEVIRTKQDV